MTKGQQIELLELLLLVKYNFSTLIIHNFIQLRMMRSANKQK